MPQTLSERADQAVLAVNLGTPAAPTARALRPWLAQFLGDPRVIDFRPRWVWWLILHGLILRTRPAQSAHLYKKVWTPNGSPLHSRSEALVTAIAASLGEQLAKPPRVELAMRYGEPSIDSVLRRLQDEGVRKLLVLPLFPQYSAATTASAFDSLAATCKTLRVLPELRMISDYHADPAWLDALAASVRTHWAEHGRGERLLISFHGLPQRYVDAGDPYYAQCRASAAGLRQRLGLDEQQAPMTFQSRFGRAEWLQPYTDVTVRELGAAGVRTMDVICPGFAVDCLETLEEIAIRNAEYFTEAGGEDLRYIPALNDTPAHARALAGLIADYTRDWRQDA